MAPWLIVLLGVLLRPASAQVTEAEVGLLEQVDALRTELQNQKAQFAAQIDNLIGSVNAFKHECSACSGYNDNVTMTSSPIATAPSVSYSSTPTPAFTAGLSNDILNCQLHQTVIFDSVKLNILSGYDSSTGVFTAPLNGTYAFTSTLSVQPNNKYHVAMVKGSVTNSIAYLYTDPIDLWLERSTTVLTHLDAGDKVWMACLGQSRIEGNHAHSWEGAGDLHSHFSGFLINAYHN